MSSMFARRVVIEGTLAVLSPLHVGSGDCDDDPAIDLSDEDRERLGFGANERPESARVVRDVNGRPYIPGTSLKGVLRAAAQAAGYEKPLIEALFGDIKHTDTERGVMGALTIFGAELERPVSASGRPAFEKKNERIASSLALSARTAIEDGRGVVDEHKLFYAEEVVPGTTFRFRACYQPPSATGLAEGREQAIGDLLCQLLALMASDDGIALGRGTADGAGRVHVGDWKLTHEKVDETGVFARDPDPPYRIEIGADSAITRPGHWVELTLSGEGPFFVDDWWYARQQTKKKQGKPARDRDKAEQEPQLAALREARPGNRPILPGTSLMGVLRARAEWLEKLMDANGEWPISGDGPTLAERLFGTTDRRARLVLDKLELADGAASMLATSVRLDRFSGAPIDGALFSVDCFVDPVFHATLRLVPESDPSVHRAVDSLFQSLLRDVETNGLMLGHAGNRGFGWFTVERKAGG